MPDGFTGADRDQRANESINRLYRFAAADQFAVGIARQCTVADDDVVVIARHSALPVSL